MFRGFRLSIPARSKLIIRFTCVLCLCWLLVTPADAQMMEHPSGLRLLTAMGTAETRVRPDIAEVRLGVETEAPTATEAREENATRASRIVEAIRQLAIPESDITTAVFQIDPVRRFTDGEQRGEPPIVGYRVVNIISVRTTNFDLVSRIIDSGVRAGANRVDGVSFSVRNDTVPREAALRQAVANARRSAETMAKELGVRLSRVQSVQEGGVGIIPPQPLFRGAVQEAVATPIFPGQLTVNASVTITYVIE